MHMSADWGVMPLKFESGPQAALVGLLLLVVIVAGSAVAIWWHLYLADLSRRFWDRRLRHRGGDDATRKHQEEASSGFVGVALVVVIALASVVAFPQLVRAADADAPDYYGLTLSERSTITEVIASNPQTRPLLRRGTGR